MRFGEAVLMKAEAQLRSGKAADALATINSLRAKRGVAALGALDAEAMFKEIGFEKYWEGDKRTVEVRFGKFVNGTGSTIDDEHTVLFPIPAQALVSNPNLQQNTGY